MHFIAHLGWVQAKKKVIEFANAISHAIGIWKEAKREKKTFIDTIVGKFASHILKVLK